MAGLILRRIKADWALLLSLLVGVFSVTTIAAIAPVYLSSLEHLSFSTSLTRTFGPTMDLDVFAPQIVINESSLADADRRVDQALSDNLSEASIGREVFYKGGLQLVGVPIRQLPSEPRTGEVVARGYVQYLSGLESNAIFVEGRAARGVEQSLTNVALVEAVVSTATAEFWDLLLGDQVVLVPELQSTARIQATIVGIIEPDDAESDYWDFAAGILSPAATEEIPPQGIRVAPPEPGEPPVALFIGRETLTEIVGANFPGSVISPIWFALVDNESLKELSPSVARSRIEDLATDLSKVLPGSSLASTSVLRLIRGVERRSFFSRVPLLVLLALMIVTVFFYLSMVVGYLTRSRERDTALLTTRGAGLFQLSRIYVLEAAVMAALGTVLTPFLAIGIVSQAGRLPFFTDITNGAPLPVVVTPAPFLAALLAGAATIVIIAVPGVLGVRLGVLFQRLRTSRPASQGILHRFHADIGLLVLGGLAFWELRSRGHFVSGGLFEEVEVNETLLLAPILFLLVVALVFMRLFPAVVRLIAGESPALIHLVVAATTASLIAILLLEGDSELVTSVWGPRVAAALGFGAAYWATTKASGRLTTVAWLVVQAGFVAWYLYMSPPDPGELAFTPTIALILMLPVQAIFVLLKQATRFTPVWMAVAMWHMARNPTQYTWLVLLLVLATGLAILATTVGGTLEKSQREQVFYEIVSDFRVDDLAAGGPTNSGAIQQRIAELPGVATMTPALRLRGEVNISSFELIGLEPGPFSHFAWYRDDFSANSLRDVMDRLQPRDRLEPVTLPDDATTLGIWVRPTQQLRSVALWVLLKDGNGTLASVTLGKLDQTEWSQLTTEVPVRLKKPVTLVSVQIFEPGQGNVLTPGEIHIDDIHVGLADGTTQSVEDFEGPMRWLAIRSSPLSAERVFASGVDPHGGGRSARLVFGTEAILGVRGMYLPPNVGPVPVIFSESLLEATGAVEGSVMTAVISNRRVSVEVAGTVRYFPTMDPGAGFMLGDIDTLFGHINVLGLEHANRPNEFFIVVEPESVPMVRDGITDLLAFGGRLQDRSQQLETASLDPLASSGWNAMVVLAVAVALLAAALGYVGYLLLSARLSRAEIGFLEAMGLSRLQLTALLVFEHLAIVIVAMGLGTWAGFRMSALTVSPLAVTDSGNPVVPPFLLVTNWGLMTSVYAALAVILVAALLVLTRKSGRLDLQAIARLGEL